MPEIAAPPKPPIDFTKVEALRKHLLLSVSDMAVLFGVSRMTYYGWVQGKPLRRKNEDKVRSELRKLVHVVRQHQFPTPAAIAAGQKARFLMLVKLLYPEQEQVPEEIQ